MLTLPDYIDAIKLPYRVDWNRPTCDDVNSFVRMSAHLLWSCELIIISPTIGGYYLLANKSLRVNNTCPCSRSLCAAIGEAKPGFRGTLEGLTTDSHCSCCFYYKQSQALKAPPVLFVGYCIFRLSKYRL